MLKKRIQTDNSSEELVRIAVMALLEKQGVDISVFDVRDSSQITDFYVIVTGKNPPHMKAMANELRLRMKDMSSFCFNKSGDPESGWIVADYLDVIVHVFSGEARRYYALEELWKEARPFQISNV